MSIGFATCEGGQHPDPPIHDYPLLVWVGGEVRTEDGKATTRDIVLAAGAGMPFDVIAARFGTTPEHARQALDYAIAASLL